MAADHGSDVTLGELYRMLEAQGRVLGNIQRTLELQNGRIASAETRVAVLEDRGMNDKTARWSAFGAGALSVAGAVVYWLRK